MLAFSRRAALWLPLLAVSAAWAAEDPDNTVILTTKHGKVVIRLRPDWAPKHVAQIKTLVKQQVLRRHRVPSRHSRLHGPDRRSHRHRHGRLRPCPTCRPSSTPTHFNRGMLGMARSEDPNSANSQFFICFADAGFLDGKYTAFGEVVSGMDVVDKIKAGTQANNGAVTNPDKIVTMRMAPTRSDEERRYERTQATR